VGLAVPRQDGPDVGNEAERVQHWQQVEEGGVARVVEPRSNRDGVVWKCFAATVKQLKNNEAVTHQMAVPVPKYKLLFFKPPLFILPNT